MLGKRHFLKHRIELFGLKLCWSFTAWWSGSWIWLSLWMRSDTTLCYLVQCNSIITPSTRRILIGNLSITRNHGLLPDATTCKTGTFQSFGERNLMFSIMSISRSRGTKYSPPDQAALHADFAKQIVSLAWPGLKSQVFCFGTQIWTNDASNLQSFTCIIYSADMPYIDTDQVVK